MFKSVLLHWLVHYNDGMTGHDMTHSQTETAFYNFDNLNDSSH